MSLALIGLLVSGGIYLWSKIQAPGIDRSVVSDSNTQDPTSPEAPDRSAFFGRGEGLNVLLITLDTTRADHLHCYGHPAVETPHIDALAAAGVQFTHCLAPAPITLPSHTSILTGTYPYVHGVRDNSGFRLPESQVTLAERLHELGYRTAAHVAAYVLNRECGLAQGFDTYIDSGDEHQRRGHAVTDGAIEWLCNNYTKSLSPNRSPPAPLPANGARGAGFGIGDKPFFLWVHYFDPHAPYDPPEPFLSQYDNPYCGEIAYTDQQVGRLLDALEQLGLRERTLVVLTADHGEGLGEHDEETHLYFVYNSTMHVPLIIHCPGQLPAAHRVAFQVRLIDIVPTVLAFLGHPETTAIQGENLLAVIDNEAEDPQWDAYGESLGGYLAMDLAPLRCLQAGGWKYIHAPKPELYHLSDDPGETHNRIDREPQRRDAMLERLESLIANAPPPPTASTAPRPTNADVQRFMSLGYVGGGSRTAKAGGLPARELDLLKPTGPDPKDHTAAIAQQGDATYAMLHGNYAQAEALLVQLRQQFPQSPGVACRLARSLFQQGKDDAAIEVYREIIAAVPDYAEAHYGMAKLLSRKGRIQAAITHLRQAIKADRSYSEAHYDLGVLLGKQGELNASIACYRQAIRLRPNYIDALFNLAASLVQKEQYDEGIVLYHRVIELEPADPTVHVNLGNALVRKGDYATAVQSYETALQIEPDFQPAQDRLQAVRAYLDRGR